MAAPVSVPSAAPPAPPPAAPTGVRRVPAQERSRARVERILGVARDLIAAQGSDALRMSEVAARAGVSIGSLYQYFPDKAAVVRTLAERYNAEGQACTAAELAAARGPGDLPAALGRVAAGYLAMFRAEPAMRHIWSATQVDPALRAVDAEDIAAHTALLLGALRRLWPDAAGGGAASDARLAAAARLVTQLLAHAVRVAVATDEDGGDGGAVLDAFTRLVLDGLPERLAGA
jgi:AcrR family transcriptional regulator